jgi:hypothetical protein
MKFSITERKKLTGATLSLRVLEFSAVLMPLYVLGLSGYPGLVMKNGLFSFLFRLGAMLRPRVWLLGLGWLYKLTASEVLLCFAVLLPALFAALALDALMRRKLSAARRARIGFAVYLALELILRLLPLQVNRAFGSAAAIAAFAVMALCLALTLMDLRGDREKK